jgi:hypothetical protein
VACADDGAGAAGELEEDGEKGHGLLFTRGEAAGADGGGVAFDRSDDGAG